MTLGNMSEELTTITTWAASIAEALERRQLPAPALFARAGLDYTQLRDIDARYPVSGMTALWRLSAQATGCPHFGLEVAGALQPGALHALGIALVASTSLADSFARLDRYSRIVSNAGRWIVDEEADPVVARLEVVEQGQIVADEAVDAFLAAAVRIGRLMTSGRYRPREVRLRRARPAQDAPYAEHFGCPVHFGAEHNGLLIDAASWREPLRGANPAVARATEQVVADYLVRMEQQQVTHRARQELLRLLPAGEPSLRDLARGLHLSERSLQRKLSGEGMSYTRLLDQSRHDLARSYLEQSRHSLTEIAFLLGFSDQSNFNRAFRRWTGQSPSAYRAELHGGAAGLA